MPLIIQKINSQRCTDAPPAIATPKLPQTSVRDVPANAYLTGWTAGFRKARRQIPGRLCGGTNALNQSETDEVSISALRHQLICGDSGVIFLAVVAMRECCLMPPRFWSSKGCLGLGSTVFVSPELTIYIHS